MKFSIGHSVGKVYRDQAAVIVYSVQATKAKQICQVDDLDFSKEEKKKHINPSIDIIPLELVEGQSDNVTYVGINLADHSPMLLSLLITHQLGH